MDTAAPQWPQGIGVVKSVEKKPRPGKEQALNCPRCSSTNTKFCYYNNYSLSQPRYFCKACRRYWTAGGCLRNVPVGGGSRKNRRPSSSSASNDKSIAPISGGGRDSNHGGSNGGDIIGMSEYISLPFDPQNPNCTNQPLPVMEFFKPGNLSGFPTMHDFKAGLGFPVEGYYGNLHDDRVNDKRTDVFPFGEMKLQADQQIEQADQANGFWNGMSSSW